MILVADFSSVNYILFFRFHPFSRQIKTLQRIPIIPRFRSRSTVAPDITRFVVVVAPYVIDEHDRYIRRLWLLIVSSMVVTECRLRPIRVSLPWIESIYQVRPSWLVLKGGLLLGLEQDTLIE